MATVLSQELFASLADWPSEQEAAAALGCSVKSIHRYADKGLIELRKRQRLGVKPENVCNPADIEKLKPTAFLMPAEEDAGKGAVAVRRPLVPNNSLVPLVPIFEAISNAVQTMQTETTAARQREEKLVLTLREAALSGFSMAYLRRAVAAGKLKHFRDGRSIKIAREELQRFAKSAKTLPVEP
jgi:excisionase family DNA binding protein